MKKFLRFVLTIGVALFAAQAIAVPPQTINYQGYLTNSGNPAVPVSTPQGFTFRLYDALTSGNLLWSATQANVPVTNGVFNVVLGGPLQSAPFPPTLVFDKPYFLSVQVSPDAEMSPRQPLASSPYAFSVASISGLATSTRYVSTLPDACTLNVTSGEQRINCPGTATNCQTYNGAVGPSPSRCNLITDSICKKYCFDNFTGGQNSIKVAQKLTFNAAGRFSFSLDKSWVCFQNGNIAARGDFTANYCPDAAATQCVAPTQLATQNPSLPFGTSGFLYTDVTGYTALTTETSLAAAAPQNVQIWLAGSFASLTTGVSTTCWLVKQNNVTNFTNTLDVQLTPFGTMQTW
jgi:hypothetical protein